MLSQDNLDNEISALSLANEQLETALMAQTGKTDKTNIMKPWRPPAAVV